MSADARTRYYLAVDALNRGDWKNAQALAMDLVREVPPHAGVYFVAGVASRELMQIPLAIDCLEKAVRLNPSRADYIAQLARAWAQASEPGRALELADRAASMPGDDAVALDALGLVYSQAHAYDKATRMFQRVVQLQPGQARYRFNYATALVHAGDAQGAQAQLMACISIDRHYWKAYTLRSQLRRQTASDNHIAELEALLTQAADDRQAVLALNMALSKELEDIGRDADALDRLVAGKAAVRATRGDCAARDRALFEAIMETAPAGGDGCDDPQPIFVFGLPRTGTTLVERIISSHSSVYSAGELQNFGVVFKRATGSVTPPILDLETVRRSGAVDWRKLGERYVASTRPATAGWARFVDKLPHNFLYAGYIAAALPNARMICLRRNPMDSCISNFRQLFAATSHYDYSLDLLDTGRYYLLFDRLMAFWQQRLPGRILEVKYEDVVADLEASARKLLGFCGLEWEEACLRFEQNAAPVATASALQVRSPIYRSSIGRWKRYGSKLDDLRRLLEDGGVDIGG